VCVCLCSLNYSARKALAPYYTVICGLSGCTVFFSFLSHKRQYFRNIVIEIRVWGRGRCAQGSGVEAGGKETIGETQT
jgi:hypothetical protein